MHFCNIQIWVTGLQPELDLELIDLGIPELGARLDAKILVEVVADDRTRGDDGFQVGLF